MQPLPPTTDLIAEAVFRQVWLAAVPNLGALVPGGLTRAGDSLVSPLGAACSQPGQREAREAADHPTGHRTPEDITGPQASAAPRPHLAVPHGEEPGGMLVSLREPSPSWEEGGKASPWSCPSSRPACVTAAECPVKEAARPRKAPYTAPRGTSASVQSRGPSKSCHLVASLLHAASQ